jgi:hypothetical protein
MRREGRVSGERELLGAIGPEPVKLLLVAEASPAALDRYFYFADVQVQDSLFRYVVRGVLGEEPDRQTKKAFLMALQAKGVFLIDLKPDPVDGSNLSDYVPGLIRRARKLDPQRIILIKATVHDAAYGRLLEAEMPVINERIPFPGSGRQTEFGTAFARALKAKPQGTKRRRPPAT